MNIKKEIVLEIHKDSRIYRFTMPEDAPLGEVYDVGFQMLKQAVQLASNAIQQNESQVAAQHIEGSN